MTNDELTVTEFAREVERSRSSVKKWIYENRIRSRVVTFGGRHTTLIPRSEIEVILGARTVRPTPVTTGHPDQTPPVTPDQVNQSSLVPVGILATFNQLIIDQTRPLVEEIARLRAQLDRVQTPPAPGPWADVADVVGIIVLRGIKRFANVIGIDVTPRRDRS